MKKHWLSMVIISLVIVVLALAACAAPAPAPSPSPAPTPAPAPQPAAPKLLKFASDIPEKGAISPAWIWYLDEIEKQTGGKVKFDRYWGGSLVKQAEQVDALMAGVVDITNSNVLSRRQLLPLSHVFNLPTTVFPDTAEGHKIGRETALAMIAKYPELSNEYKDFKLLTWSTDPYRMCVSKPVVHVPDDLKGLKMGAEGTGQDIAKAAGATPVMIIPPETYMSLERNVITATIAVGWNHVQVFKLWEVAKNYLEYGFGQGATCLFMNNDSWASLSPDVQKVMMDLLPECLNRCDQGLLGSADVARKSVADNGGTIYTPTAAEAQLWEKVKAPSEQIWLDEMKAKGLTNAPKILDEVKQAANKAWGR